MSRRTVAGSPATQSPGIVRRSPAVVPFGFSASVGAAAVAAACPGDGVRLGRLVTVAVPAAALGAVASSPAPNGGAS